MRSVEIVRMERGVTKALGFDKAYIGLNVALIEGTHISFASVYV